MDKPFFIAEHPKSGVALSGARFKRRVNPSYQSLSLGTSTAVFKPGSCSVERWSVVDAA